MLVLLVTQSGVAAQQADSAELSPAGGVHVGSGASSGDASGISKRTSSGSAELSAAGSNCPVDQHCWYEGGVDAGSTYNCTIIGNHYYESLGRSWVGWRGNLDSNPTKPRTGDVYYTKIGWGVSGFPCGNGGAYVHIELFLPANTQLAISSQNPVQCFYESSQRPRTNYTNDPICPQSPSSGMQGGYSFSPKTGDASYPTPRGGIWEIFIPVKTTAPVTSGYSATGPCASCLGAAVWMIDGNYSPWSYPRVGVYVDGPGTMPPAVTYPAPSVRNIRYDPDAAYPDWPSYAETVAHVNTAGTSGQGWFEIGKTKEYGTNSPVTNIANGNWEIWNAWRMEAGETWHWRFCYKPTNQAKICGANQSFETAPPPDTTPPTASFKKKPPLWTNKTTASFEFDSNETNVQFACNLDYGGWEDCDSRTPTFKNLSEGQHRLSIFATDASGNWGGNSPEWVWNVDLTKPQTTLESGPSGKTRSRKATFGFSSSEPGTFLCSLDGARFRKCGSPKSYENLSSGKHVFKVKAKDRATNVDGTPAVREWTVTS